MTAFYKATRPDGTSFHDATTAWRVGRITRHPAPDLTRGLCSDGVLHFSDAPAETLVGGSWPCRLFEVAPRGAMVVPLDLDGHKFGCGALKVVAELPAWRALGPNGERVAAVIERAGRLTPDEVGRLAAAWDAARSAARSAAWGAAWDAARDAARDAAQGAAQSAARGAAWDAARDAVAAEVVSDLITAEQYDLLTSPWRSAVEDTP